MAAAIISNDSGFRKRGLSHFLNGPAVTTTNKVRRCVSVSQEHCPPVDLLSLCACTNSSVGAKWAYTDIFSISLHRQHTRCTFVGLGNCVCLLWQRLNVQISSPAFFFFLDAFRCHTERAGAGILLWYKRKNDLSLTRTRSVNRITSKSPCSHLLDSRNSHFPSSRLRPSLFAANYFLFFSIATIILIVFDLPINRFLLLFRKRITFIYFQRIKKGQHMLLRHLSFGVINQ